MKPFFSLHVLGLSILCSDLVRAYKIHVEGHLNDPAGLRRRGSLSGSSPLENSADIMYYANITLNDKHFKVLIDTGSSDLWVAGTVPDAEDSGARSGVNYAIGAVKGPIKYADLDFAGYNVSKQAFLEITPDDTNPANKGLIGLGPSGGSRIWEELKNADSAAPFLDRVFVQNRETPNYLTTLLGRSSDPTDIFAGDITIGEVIPAHKEVLNAPKLPVSIVPVREAGDQHFQILLDADGLIGPDGKPITAETEVDETKNQKQLTAIVDTGFSLSQLPKVMADDIYSRVSGSQFVNVSGVGPTWIVPCNQEVNITFKFAGLSYPIHPFDATLEPDILGLGKIVNDAGEDSCLGMFQPIIFDVGNSPNYDIILGMSFLRNVYVLHDFGDFVVDDDKRGDPYLQFLSVTDPAEAHSEFVSVRLQGVDTTGQQTLSAARPRNSSSSTSKRTIYLIIGIICIVLAVLIAVVAIVLSRRRRNRNHTKTGVLGKYQTLDTPNYNMKPMGSAAPINNSNYAPTAFNPDAPYGQPYEPPSYSASQPPAPYNNPFDQRPHH